MSHHTQNHMKNVLAIMLLGVSLYLGSRLLYSGIIANYQYDQKYGNFWSLADKSSTIERKSELINQFIAALEKGNSNGEFASHNAIFLKTDNNSFRENITALKTLAERLREIRGMDPRSFEYNSAIQQITAQEQGEAGAMLGTLEDCYRLAVHPSAWKWLSVVYLTSACIFGFIGLFILIED